MKISIIIAVLTVISVSAYSQTIVGRWQLVKQSNCVEDQLGEEDEDTQALIDDMKSRAGASAQVLELRANNTGQESTKLISKKKSYNSKSFLYRYSDDGLYFLDKKSRTIIEGFTVEKLDGESLIISNSARVCETKVFQRIK